MDGDVCAREGTTLEIETAYCSNVIRVIIFLLQASNIENQSRRRSRILRDFHEYKIIDFEVNDGLLNKWKFRSPLTTLSALLVDLVQGMPSSIAISFPRCLPLAAVDRPSPRQSAEVGESGHLLVMIHSGSGASLPFLPLSLATVPPVATRFSPAVVPVPAVVPRQAAVQILRGRVRTLPERSLVSTTRFHEHHAPAIRFRRAASLLTALRPAAQMFAQPFPQSAATAAAVVPRLANPPRRRRISPVLAPATRKEKMENVRKFDFSENKWGK